MAEVGMGYCVEGSRSGSIFSEAEVSTGKEDTLQPHATNHLDFSDIRVPFSFLLLLKNPANVPGRSDRQT